MTSSNSDIHEAVYGQPASDGRFTPRQLRTLRELGSRRTAVILAFPPKAAGTFLRAAIIKAVDGQLVRIVHAQGGRDATPYLPALVQYYEGKTTDKTLVTHVHMLALTANLHILSAFGIKPIIMVRSIPDMLASYWDMLETDDESLSEGLNCHIPPNFREMTRNAKADFIVDVLGPWYVNYYAGWITCSMTSQDSVCPIDFRALKEDPAAVVEHCLQHVGLPRDKSVCETAVRYAWERRKELRFNKGQHGRGETYFRPAQLNRLARIVGHYPVLAAHRDILLSTGKAARVR